jgi:hypothetical protein
MDGGKLTKTQALVRASKEFPLLRSLLKEYKDELKTYDVTDPAEAISNQSGKAGAVKVVSRDVELSYRECLRWASQAAGAKLRAGTEPIECPNDTCFYLYRMAIENPKDFMGKMAQVETKIDKDEEVRQNKRMEARRSVAEIQSYLDTLEEERYEEDSEYQTQENAAHQGSEANMER